MSEQQERRIVEGELLSEPHINGRRISVLTIYDRVEERGLDPKTVADRLDLDVADVHRALVYYYDHPEQMQTLKNEREQLRKQADGTGNEARSLE